RDRLASSGIPASGPGDMQGSRRKGRPSCTSAAAPSFGPRFVGVVHSRQDLEGLPRGSERDVDGGGPIPTQQDPDLRFLAKGVWAAGVERRGEDREFWGSVRVRPQSLEN